VRGEPVVTPVVTPCVLCVAVVLPPALARDNECAWHGDATNQPRAGTAGPRCVVSDSIVRA
jgi:hypothetical protein